MEKFILARLKNNNDFDFEIHSMDEPDLVSWYDPECFWSEPFEEIKDVKFTENGMMGLYFYTEDVLKRKLEELSESAKTWARNLA